MDQVWIPLLSALVGTLIGSGTAIISIFVQNYFQNKRDTTKLAYEAAIQDHKTAVDLIKSTGQKALVSPLAAYICYHTKMLDLALERTLTRESLTKLDEEMDSMHEVFRRKPKEKKTPE